MKRAYFLIPDVDNAVRVVKGLEQIGVRKNDMHVIIKKGDQKLEMTPILRDNLFKTTDLTHALVQGGLIGAVIGFLTGIFIVEFLLKNLGWGSETIIGLTVFGVLFGAWASSLIGIAIPNPLVEKLEEAAEAGGILLLVDLPEDKKKPVLSFMKTYHPETTVHGFKLL